ncbi:MAG: 30S ribosomal protein S4 [Candidatus Omnitrophica bacterium]|nr:30S ribosomal protein S4 [Candidatus Omnitrophota bacterium]MBU4457446.1 30S ribosomal protein S4 [Candidatus Omnitrophota bacterium]
MARYTGSSCRVCRREGEKLFLKGTRCFSDKCAFTRRSYVPGQHGKGRRFKPSNYGIQLREKQKVKKIYGILEKQFRKYFKLAERSKGVTGEKLLEILERRLDNVVFRSCFAYSRAQARQMVRHGLVHVNNRKVNIPSYSTKTGDVIQLKQKDKLVKNVKEIIEKIKDRGVPEWLKEDFEGLKASVTRLPERSDVGMNIKEQLIVELYSK